MFTGLRHALLAEEPSDAGGSAPPAAPPAAEPAAAPEESKEPSTVLSADPAPAASTPGSWPSEWRNMFAGDSEQDAERLKRFGSPADVYKSYRALEKKMSDGSLKSDFPAEGTEDEQKAWRESQGVPVTAEGYHEILEDGLVIGDDDKELVNSFFESAHSRNARPAEVNAAVSWYYDMQERQREAQEQADAEARRHTDDALRAEWGEEYRPTINVVSGLLDLAPEGVSDMLKSSRGPDGTPIFSNPDTIRFFAHLAREINPAGTIVPEAGMNQLKTVQSRIGEIENTMRTDRSAYNRNEGMQRELRELYEAQEKLQARAG